MRSAPLALLLAVSACAVPHWPVRGRVTSPYGVRFEGLLPSVHRGVDISVPEGTEVRPMTAGRVRFAGIMDGFGNVVWVDHGGEVLTVYAHLSTIFVRVGEPVARESVLGLSGSTGDASAPHLHFEVWRWNRSEDPVALLGGFPGDG